MHPSILLLSPMKYNLMRVLLPVDSDKERAIAVAEVVKTLSNTGATIHATILNVQNKIDVSDSGGRVSSEEWFDDEDFPESVDVLQKILEDEDVLAKKRREHADPAESIIEIAEDINADWILMAGRKRTPVGKVLFGSVTQSVLLNADIPVTVVPVQSD